MSELPEPQFNPTRIFLDTEFTELGSHAALISLGAVTESGESYYAEVLEEWTDQAVSPFVRSQVLPQLNAPGVLRLSLMDLANSFGEWIRRNPGSVQVVSDSGWDWTMIRKLYSGERESAMPPMVPQIIRLSGRPLLAFNDEVAAYFLRNPSARPHHALGDAMALRAAYKRTHP